MDELEATEPGTTRRGLDEPVDDMAARTARRFDRIDAALEALIELVERKIRDRQTGSVTAGR